MTKIPCLRKYPSSWSSAQKGSASCIEILLNKHMGASPYPFFPFSIIEWLFNNTIGIILKLFFKFSIEYPKSHFSCGLLVSLIYIVILCVPQYFIVGKYNNLLLLSLWGGFHSGFAVIIARFTSQSVQRTILKNIISKLDDNTASAIADELKNRFKKRRIKLVSYSVSTVGIFVSGVALKYDLDICLKIQNMPLLNSIKCNNSASLSIFEIGIWAIGFWFLYVVASRAADVAQFYKVFAVHLHLLLQSESIYALDPAHSALVADIASIGRRIWLFMFGIALSILTLVPLFFRRFEVFIIMAVPITVFFSILLATIVFRSADSAIRRVVQERTSSTLANLEQEISRLFDKRNNLIPAAEIIDLCEPNLSIRWT